MILCALRELDFHDRLTTKNIDEVAFFRSARVPLAEKAVVTGVYVGLAAFGLWLVRRAAPGWIRGLQQREDWAVSTLGALGMLVVSQVLDRSAVDAKHRWGSDVNLAMHLAEEILELAAPVLFTTACAQGARAARHGTARRSG